ncbi:hypothetical protein MKX03_021517 [Papaver bracteatum]|nr:hypothetical protein MKX03_021517 [Papaver bracteatum]
MDEYGHNNSSDEFGRFVNACLTIFSSLTYFIYIFTLIPLNLSSFHLTFVLGYYISWLASFKLVLFSFDKGPLSSDPTLASSSSPSPMTFLLFLGIACLPIQVRQSSQSSVHFHALYYYVLEGFFLGLLSLVIYAVLARLLLDVDVDSPFGNYVFLSTSFSDFWGKRWNVMTSRILKSIVYEPVRHVIKGSWGVYIAILVTFFVSGLMHELLIFYVFRKQPCWDVLVFFVLHGIGAAVENKLKRFPTRKWQLNRMWSILLMDGFLVCSSFALLFPFFDRLNFPEKVIEEIANFTKLLIGGTLHQK